MKFMVNSKDFAEALKPSYEVAIRNAKKGDDDRPSDLITLEVKKEGITVKATGTSVALISEISDKNYGSLGYTCKEEGVITVGVKNLVGFLHSFPPTNVEISEKKGEAVIVYKKDTKRLN